MVYCLYYGLYLRNIPFHRKFYKIQNVCMLNIFTFVMFSLCHSLGQSVLGIALFYFGLYLRNMAFQRKLYKIENISIVIWVYIWCVFSLSLTRSVSHGCSLVYFGLYIRNILSTENFIEYRIFYMSCNKYRLCTFWKYFFMSKCKLSYHFSVCPFFCL